MLPGSSGGGRPPGSKRCAATPNTRHEPSSSWTYAGPPESPKHADCDPDTTISCGNVTRTPGVYDIVMLTPGKDAITIGNTRSGDGSFGIFVHNLRAVVEADGDHCSEHWEWVLTHMDYVLRH